MVQKYSLLAFLYLNMATPQCTKKESIERSLLMTAPFTINIDELLLKVESFGKFGRISLKH